MSRWAQRKTNGQTEAKHHEKAPKPPRLADMHTIVQYLEEVDGKMIPRVVVANTMMKIPNDPQQRVFIVNTNGRTINVPLASIACIVRTYVGHASERGVHPTCRTWAYINTESHPLSKSADSLLSWYDDEVK